MNKKRSRCKNTVLLLFSLVLIILISSLVSADCCVNPQSNNFCKGITDITGCCIGTCPDDFDLYEKGISCNSASSICTDIGCCKDLCTYGSRSECTTPNAFVPWKTCYDASITECQKGCCITLDTNNKPSICYDGEDNQGIYISECADEFSPGTKGPACDQICQLSTLPKATIKGFVYDKDNNIAGYARVVLGLKKWAHNYPQTHTTPGYKFTDIPYGNYKITAYYEGHEPSSEDITLLQETLTDGILTVDFHLTAETKNKGHVSGEVKKKGTTNFIENALVSCAGKSDVTDSEGKYFIENIDAGAVICKASALGYFSKINPVDIIAGKLEIINFDLTPITETPIVCGDGKKEGTEACDDGSTIDCNPYPGCAADCSREQRCGDGIKECGEECDGGEGCTSGCKIEAIFEKGWLNGYVTNKETQAGVNGATITVLKGTSTIATDTTKINPITRKNGFYQIFLKPDTYTVKASKQNYYTKEIGNIQIQKNTEKPLNIQLEPLPVECLTSLPIPTLQLSNIKGKTNIKIEWTQNCIQEFNVNKFELYIKDKGNYVFIKSFNIDENEYEDDGKDIGGLKWDTWYEYKLRTIAQKQPKEVTAPIFTGNPLCEDITTQQFCWNKKSGEKEPPMKSIAACNNNNNIDIVQDCAEGKICIERDNTVSCITPDDCTNLGIPSNIFGMFYYDTYADLTCLKNTTSNKKRYCYYDYYKRNSPFTTVDRCLNCKQEETCFDYQSDDACTTDNCGYGTIENKCKWFGVYEYKYLGKGFCYQENYKETDYCELCSKDNELFKNTFCTKDLCTKLGNCYSIEDSCKSCENSACEDYTDRLSCTNNINFNIPNIPNIGACNSSDKFVYSEDACGLKLCKWAIPQGESKARCFKDGNDDNIPDCRQDITSCQTDTIAPITSITLELDYISSNGKNIEFSTDADAANTYYCIDKQKCCPNKKVINKQVLLPNYDFPLKNTEGNYNISFFSVDTHYNTETLKTKTIYVNTIPPTIEITTLPTNSTITSYSDLTVTINVNKNSSCQDSLKFGNNPLTPLINSQWITTETDISITYTDLSDGIYFYSIECTDIYGNVGKNEALEYIDKIKEITVISPTPNQVLKNPLTILLSTPDENYCRYKDETNNWNDIGNNKGQGIFNSSTNDFRYKKILAPLTSRTYNYFIKCYKEPALQNLSDQTNLVFTVDELKPQTTAKYEISTGTFIPLENIIYKDPKIKLECQDTPEKGFGCKETRYCYDAVACTPNTILSETGTFTISNTNNIHLCYYSVDNGNNKEQTKCQEIKIDKTPPNLTITITPNHGTTELPKITYGTYAVTIKSNEPLKNITELKFKVNNNIYDKFITVIDVSNDNKTWHYNIQIPTRTDFANLQGINSEFIIEAQDQIGNAADSSYIIQGRYFEIDTTGPTVSIIPDIPEYTRQISIRITGFTEANIPVNIDINGTPKSPTISAQLSNSIDSAKIYDPNNEIDKGKNKINVWNNKETTFIVGKHIEFTNHKRLHRERYEITKSEYNASTALTLIEFTPALEGEITNNEIVKVFNENVPTGWFEFNPTFNTGKNIITFRATDAIGNIGLETNKTIIYDSQPFEILSYSPINQTITSNNKPNITAIIKDDISGINTNSIKLAINNKTYTYNELTPYIEDEKLYLTYKPTQELTDGAYTINLSGEDIAGNYKERIWSFDINQQIPSEPQFRITNGNYYAPYELWYINSKTPQIEIEFNSSVILTNVKLVTNSSNNVTCNAQQGYIFYCSFDSQLPEAKHKLQIKAKNFDKGLEGKWTKEFVVDKTPPALTFTNLYPVNKPQVDVQGTYEDLSMDTDSIITIKGEISEEKKATITAKVFSASINLNNNIEKEYTIRAEAYDRASNYGYTTAKIPLDLTAGTISVTDVISTNGTGKIVKTPKGYKTNIDKIKGITIHGTTQEDLRLYIYQNRYQLTDLLYTSDKQFSFTLTLVDGLNNILITGEDMIGNPTEYNETVEIELDKKGPTINITIG